MKKPLPLCLFLLRLAVFIVILLWAIDKFIRPLTEAGMYHHAYYLPLLPVMVIYAIGAFQVLLAGRFVIGLQRTLTTALVMVGMLIYTLASHPLYWPPFHGDNLLFFAAWPMLAACIALYLLRRQDTWLALS